MKVITWKEMFELEGDEWVEGGYEWHVNLVK